MSRQAPAALVCRQMDAAAHAAWALRDLPPHSAVRDRAHSGLSIPRERIRGRHLRPVGTRRLRESLNRQSALKSAMDALEEVDCTDYLAPHLIRQTESALRGMPGEDRQQQQIELANTLMLCGTLLLGGSESTSSPSRGRMAVRQDASACVQDHHTLTSAMGSDALNQPGRMLHPAGERPDQVAFAARWRPHTRCAPTSRGRHRTACRRL